MTQNAITNPSLKSVLRNVGKNVTLSRNCERKSPLTRNRVPSSSAMRACRRSATIARLFCRTLNWQYLCKAFVVFSVRPGSMLSFGRKIVVLVLASPPIDVGLSSLLISSMPERKCAFFEKGSSAGCVNRSWMLSGGSSESGLGTDIVVLLAITLILAVICARLYPRIVQ